MKTIFMNSRIVIASIVMTMILGSLMFTSCNDVDESGLYQPVEKLVAPANPAVVTEAITENELKFVWDEQPDAHQYSAQIRLNEHGDVISEVITSNTDVMFGDLKDGTTYYFRVKAIHEYIEGSNSVYTEWITADTKPIDLQYDPLQTPKDVHCDASSITATTLKFAWEVVENAASYTYRYSAEGVDEVFANTENLTVELTGLVQGVEYSFSVKANPIVDSEEHRSSTYSSAVLASTVAVLATPQNVVNTLKMAEAASFEWDEVSNANSYEFELYVGDKLTPVITSNTDVAKSPPAGDGISVETTNNSATFIGLNKDTYYSFRVKALPTSGNSTLLESEFTDYCVVKTLLTDAVPLTTPAPGVESFNQIKASVTWSAVTSAASYEYQFGKSEADAETAGSVLIEADVLTGALPNSIEKTSLEPATTYFIRVKAIADINDATKCDSEWSSWMSFKTSELATTLRVTNIEELMESFDCIAKGGIITVASGDYFSESTISLTKAVTLQGESSTDRPNINLKMIYLRPATACGPIVIKDIEFTSNKLDDSGNVVSDSYLSNYFIDNSGMAASISSLTIDNCMVHSGFKSAFLRLNRVSGFGVEDLTVTNNIVRVGGNDGNIIGANGKEFSAKNWVIKNNTFDAIGTYYGATKKAQLIRLPSTTSSTFDVEISNNTFYNISAIKGKSLIGAEGSNYNIVVTKNILTLDPSIGAWTGTLGVSSSISSTDNFVFGSDGQVIEGFTELNPEINAYMFLQNYKPNASAVTAAGAGDTRWLE